VRLRTKAVFESDTFHVIEGTEPKLEHVPDLSAEQSWDTLVAVYVVAHYKDGSKDFVVIRKADIEKRRANSDSYKRNKNQSPWGQWPIEMALKTGLRYAFARGIVTMDDTTTSAYEHDGIQDAPAEDLNVVDMNEVPEVNTMNVLSEQLDELVQQTDAEESLLED
jgi:recombinational DNA repair protein RecT